MDERAKKKWPPAPDWAYGELPDWTFICEGPPQKPVTSMDLLSPAENVVICESRGPEAAPSRYEVGQALLTLRKAGILKTAVAEVTVSASYFAMHPNKQAMSDQIWNDMLRRLANEIKESDFLKAEKDDEDSNRMQQNWRLKIHIVKANWEN